jgi:hypothetical protein
VQEAAVSKERHLRAEILFNFQLLDIKQIIDDLDIGTPNRGIAAEQEHGAVQNSDSRMAEFENWGLEDDGDSDEDEGACDSWAGYSRGLRGGKFAESCRNAGKAVDLVYYETAAES